MKTFLEKIQPRFGLGLCFCLIISSYFRIFYGVDLTDESGYVGIPYTFALGSKPFFDEVAITQNVGILIYPCVKLYLSLFSNADGLVLFVRHLYFLLTVLAGFFVFNFARRIVKFHQALLVGMIPVCFIPFSIPSLSYNTVGALGLLAGIFCYLGLFTQRESKFWMHACAAGGTAFFCAASYGYPSLGIVGGLAVFFTIWQISTDFPKPLRNGLIQEIATVSFLGLVLALGSIVYAGMENVHRIISFYKAVGANFGGANKFLGLVSALYRYITSSWMGLTTESGTGMMIIYFGLIPFPWILNLKGQAFKVLKLKIRLYWCLGLLAGLICGWTSSNGIYNGFIGLLSTVCLNFVCLFKWFNDKKSSSYQKWAIEVFTPLFLVWLQYGNYRFIYRDGPWEVMTQRFSKGPYAGLWTIPEKKVFVENLQSDLRALLNKSGDQRPKSVHFFDDFPAGYLLTSMARHAQSIWTIASGPWIKYDRKKVTEYYDNPNKLPDLAVHVTSYPRDAGVVVQTESTRPDPLLNIFLSTDYTVVLEKPEYIIYQRLKAGTINNRK